MNLKYKKPWEELELDNRLHIELEREVSKGHKLYGIKTIAIARRVDCDDFLFKLLDDTGRFAVVHLTWGTETDPIWPWTEIYTDVDEWKNNRMTPDIQEWSDFE